MARTTRLRGGERWAAVALCVAFVGAAAAADLYWSNTSGGVYNTGANWAGGVAPGATDTANFNLGSASFLSIALGEACASQAFRVHTDRVSFDLGGLAYATSGDFQVGVAAGTSGVLALSNGTVTVGGNSYVAYPATGSTGSMTADGVVWDTTLDTMVGGRGTGALEVVNGSDLTMRNFYIAYAGFSPGTVTIDGSGTSVAASTRVHCGYSTAGELNITGGATVSSGERTFFGTNPGSHGAVTVDGAGSTLVSAYEIFCGEGGSATVSITDGGAIFSTGLRTASSDSSVVSIDIAGAGSRWVMSGSAFYCRRGQSSLTVSDGGLFQTNTAGTVFYMADQSVAANGSITVTGEGSQWLGLNTYIGGSSSAAMGTARVNANSSGLVSMANVFKIWGPGTLSLGGGLVEMPPAKKVENLGLLTGNGVIRRSGASGTMTVENKNNCTPGGSNATGVILIQNGLFTQTSTGKLTIELNSVSAYDQVIAPDAAVTVDGNVEAKVLATHDLHAGDTFDVVIGNTVTLGGSFTFTNIVHPRWTATYAVVTIASGEYAGKQALRLTLTKLPPVVENLGPVYMSAGISQVSMWRDKYDAMHLMVIYRRANQANTPQFIHVEMATGTAYLLTAPIGGRLWKPAYDPATHAICMGSSDPGSYMKYDLATHTTAVVRTPLADKGVQTQCNADDGTIYIGECVKGYLERYDPSTGTWYNYGIIDDPGPPYYRYVYTLGADTRYAYCGMGQDPWYLVILDTQTATQTVYWENDNCTGATVVHGNDGYWYVIKTISGQPTACYRFENGAPVYVGSSVPGGYVPWYMIGAVCNDQAYFASVYNYEVNLDDAIPDSGNNATATIRYRQVGAQTWSQVSVSNMIVDAQLVKRMVTRADGSLVGVINAYQPAFMYNTAQLLTTVLGNMTQASMYDILLYDHRYYFSGYPSTFAEYDSSQSWTLTPSTPDWTQTSVNPHNISVTGAKYNYFLTTGPGGRVYIGAHRERDATGGAVGWYNPANGTKNKLQDPFVNNDAADLIATNGGTRLCFSTNSLNGGNGLLYVLQYNEGSQNVEVLNSYAPLPGVTSSGKVVEVAPGVVFGVQGAQAYRFNLNTGVRDYLVNLPGTHSFGQNVASYDRRLLLGPDGKVWLFVEDSGAQTTKLYRFDPSNGAAELMVDNIGNRRGRPFVFVGDDIYMYGGGNVNLERIQDLLP